MTKYKWANKFTRGKVLDISQGKHLSYSSSVLLLENNTNEIWNLDFLDIQQYVSLRKLDKDKITYQLKDRKELDSIKFDTILAFNILSTTENINKTLKFIFEHLNQNGILITSIINDDLMPDSNHDLITNDLNLFSKNELEENLKLYFKNISFFSQGIISNNNNKENALNAWIRIKIKDFFFKSIERYNFYIKYFKFAHYFIVKKNRNKEDKQTNKYEITPFDDEKQSMFTIVKCKK
jgi:hypothetical protein